MRFYTGQNVSMDEIQRMIPAQYHGIVKAVDTDSVIGPWRKRGNMANKMAWKFVHGYANKFEVTYRSYVHLHKTEGGSFDWAVKLDYDTLFFPENFRKYLISKSLCPARPLYLGHLLFHRPIPFTAGAIYALSSSAVEKLSHTLEDSLMALPPARPARLASRKCLDIETQAEDYHLGVCLHQAGVLADLVLTRDHMGREFFQILSALNHSQMEFNASKWFWKNKGFTAETANQKEKCCADFPINFHNYKNDDFIILYEQIYEGEGAILPSGDFDLNRLSMTEILKFHWSLSSGNYSNHMEEHPVSITKDNSS
mmetsp:Transcript_25088/g.34573  ORF Transcript_25088/g.34573 Transcript_25088/m.34573 type:complete len:312 (+) Transcript_25088:2-937(+)